MAISSPISLGRTSQSASSLKFLSKETGKKTLGISKLLSRGIERKNNLWSSTKLFRNRRIGIEKRVALRDQFRLPLLIGRPTGPRTAALTDTSSSVADRLLGFIGYFSAGWILRNLPTWISIGEQFSSRIVSVGSILSNYGDETLRAMNGIKDVFQSALQNILVFDFTDSSFLVRSSLNDLKLELDALGQGLEDAFNVLFQPFKDVPGIGTLQPDDPTQTPTPSPTPSGGNSDFWLLSLISLYESSNPQGAADVAQSIYNRMGYSGRTARQEILAQNQYTPVGKFGNASAWNKVVDRETAIAHIKKYPGNSASVNNLDKVAAALTNKSMQQSAAKFVGNRPDFRSQGYERQNNAMTDDTTRNGQTFGFNRGSAYIGKSNTAANVPNLGTTTIPSVSQVPGKITTSVVGDVDIVGNTNPTVGRSSEYLSRGGAHKGIDIGTSGQRGYYVAFRQSGKVIFAGWNSGGFGNLVIIQSGNLKFYFAHLAKIMVKSGSQYKGETIGEIGNTGRSKGEHLHYEVRSGGSHINPEPYLGLLAIGKTLRTTSGQIISPAPMTSLVPGTPSITMESEDGVGIDSNNYYSNFLNDIQQERKGRKIIIIDDRGSTISQQVITSDGGGRDIQIQIPESALLNNFIKNKLLLDLNYL
jgi:murein DD-endopeptidase MepM/ murein hydrolase activator NlpD